MYFEHSSHLDVNNAAPAKSDVVGRTRRGASDDNFNLSNLNNRFPNVEDILERLTNKTNLA